jgi:hypothetical protein
MRLVDQIHWVDRIRPAQEYRGESGFGERARYREIRDYGHRVGRSWSWRKQHETSGLLGRGQYSIRAAKVQDFDEAG